MGRTIEGFLQVLLNACVNVITGPCRWDRAARHFITNNSLLVCEVRLEAEVDTSFGSFSPSSLILVKHSYGDTRAVEDHHPAPVTCKDINGREKHITLWVIIALSFTHRNVYNKANYNFPRTPKYTVFADNFWNQAPTLKNTDICPLAEAVTASASILGWYRRTYLERHNPAKFPIKVPPEKGY